MPLISLAYVSKSRNKPSDAELQALVEQSRHNNAENDITSLLLYRDGLFIHDLEGEQEAVEAMYERIHADPRHEEIRLMHKTPIESRTYTDEPMAFRNLDQLDPYSMERYTQFLLTPSLEYFEQDLSRATEMLFYFRPHMEP